MTNQTLIEKKQIYSLADYQKIFDLTNQDLQKKLLDFPAGVSSVNAELNALGLTMVSADPLYSLNQTQMQRFAQDNLKKNIAETQDPILIANWKRSTELFLDDYEKGQQQGRYIAMPLPPFSQSHSPYELLLCMDLLFSQSFSKPYETTELMNDLAKLAAEVRIYPLPEDKSSVNCALGPIMLEFQQRNFGVEVKAIEWPNEGAYSAMLRIWAKECLVDD